MRLDDGMLIVLGTTVLRFRTIEALTSTVTVAGRRAKPAR